MSVAWMFPGQGSQRSGMGASWQHTDSFELVSRAGALIDVDAEHLLLSAGDHELVEPLAAQVSTFLHSCLVLDRIGRSTGWAGSAENFRSPVAVAGHSLGEYSALVAAQVLTFEDGLRLVAERGAAMSAAASARLGSMMAVVGLDADRVEEVCAQVTDCWPANENSADQIVISGTAEALAAVGDLLARAGARMLRRIPVGGAYHSPLMVPAANRLALALGATTFSTAAYPVVCNVDAAAHREAADFPTLLQAQLTSRVRWAATMQTLAHLGADTLLEMGPGKVLTNLARRSASGVDAHIVNTPAQVDALVDHASRGVA